MLPLWKKKFKKGSALVFVFMLVILFAAFSASMFQISIATRDLSGAVVESNDADYYAELGAAYFLKTINHWIMDDEGLDRPTLIARLTNNTNVSDDPNNNVDTEYEKPKPFADNTGWFQLMGAENSDPNVLLTIRSFIPTNTAQAGGPFNLFVNKAYAQTSGFQMNYQILLGPEVKSLADGAGIYARTVNIAALYLYPTNGEYSAPQAGEEYKGFLVTPGGTSGVGNGNSLDSRIDVQASDPDLAGLKKYASDVKDLALKSFKYYTDGAGGSHAGRDGDGNIEKSDFLVVYDDTLDPPSGLPPHDGILPPPAPPGGGGNNGGGGGGNNGGGGGGNNGGGGGVDYVIANTCYVEADKISGGKIDGSVIFGNGNTPAFIYIGGGDNKLDIKDFGLFIGPCMVYVEDDLDIRGSTTTVYMDTTKGPVTIIVGDDVDIHTTNGGLAVYKDYNEEDFTNSSPGASGLPGFTIGYENKVDWRPGGLDPKVFFNVTGSVANPTFNGFGGARKTAMIVFDGSEDGRIKNHNTQNFKTGCLTMGNNNYGYNGTPGIAISGEGDLNLESDTTNGAEFKRQGQHFVSPINGPSGYTDLDPTCEHFWVVSPVNGGDKFEIDGNNEPTFFGLLIAPGKEVKWAQNKMTVFGLVAVDKVSNDSNSSENHLDGRIQAFPAEEKLGTFHIKMMQRFE